MKYLIKRNGYYHYSRRVPETIREYDTREYVRVSLKTDSKDIAIQNCAAVNQRTEKFWSELITNNKRYSKDDFHKTINLCRLMGFTFLSPTDIIKQPDEDVIQRVQTIENLIDNPMIVKAIGGGTKKPTLVLSKALDQFWSYTKDRIINKSDNQIRKWKNPRKKAISNFILNVGDKALNDITRADIIKFRDWWIEKIEGGKTANSANKDLIHLKNIIETVSENLDLDIDTDKLFKKITIKERFKKTRKPFSTEFIQNTLLNFDNLKGLNKEGQYFLFAMADTGARVGEILGLLPEDIVLNHDIPHINIIERPKRPLKTPYSQRTIPLVGASLFSFKNLPNGFPTYKDRPDSFSGMLNKYLRSKDLLPSKDHSVYSLRHSFQDRLLSVNAPDRIQAELMGHKFQRPNYGEGATLEHKREILDKISIQRKIQTF